MTEKNEDKTSKKEQVTESDKIWEEIKNLPIEMFALPNQVVKQHVQRMKVSPKEVYLKLRSTAVIPSLEAALATRGKYEIEVAEGYTIVRRATQSLPLPEPEPTD